jgi:transcriptional regulator with XRE-family HTH domain
MKPTSSTPRARALAAGLRELREAHGMGLRKLARILGFAPQALSLWEKGLRLPTVADVALILGFFHVSGEQQKHLIELAASARQPSWLTAGSFEGLDTLNSMIACERTATSMTNWAHGIIPGLLQTADYARTILSNSNLSLEQADARLKIRLDRQKSLTRINPLRLNAIIHETALHEQLNNEDIMSDQYDHLLEMSRMPNVSLRVAHSSQGYHPGLLGSFIIYEYKETRPIVYLEHYHANAFSSDERHISSYRKLAKMIFGNALSEEASRALIEKKIR